MTRVAFVALGILVAAGCRGGSGAADLGTPVDMAPLAPVQKVDILFMFDNSLSVPEEQELRARFPQLVKTLDDAALTGHPASYHIGVVTSDLGSGTNTTSCKPGGDGGRLQVAPSPSSSIPTPPACSGLTFGGVNFISYDQLSGTNNIGGGVDLPTAFSCMSYAGGDSGCGFEHPLESVYKALHDPIPENHDFLRPDALLVVVFITDEDDCSAPPDTDLFEVAPDHYGTLHSFRCTKYGVTCSDPPGPLSDADAGKALTGCRPLTVAEGGKLYDVQRYIDFFTKPAALGGVKDNPANVILAAIFAPPTPFGAQITSPCADQGNTASCPILNHSCVAPNNSKYFGDPGVRMAAVVNAVPTSLTTSICETDYTPTLAWVAQKILERVQ